ncbi:3'(2'),5'-bisphosphate nucleotidase [Allomyces macrogynus ATCC 38327]|uniref:3'(2'),5'-bisphosphate nucleotidase n=1 Tax=Allomyces macrogynus (strain ATCC 38327) TaxID=578462 RepID=A0A0L0SF32_ALLM3|nr:3'(2'),5'-bisphosphate nucleotidase [Allomyces macrogynus ATCC 38327]|eukprot:KNE60975.1 3'(2'),5'-bisphosphate nucleotidase [Allomyces macrogynus ATCC 38327]
MTMAAPHAFATELAVALTAVSAAARVARHVQATLVPIQDRVIKEDKSPVTVADFASQAVVAYYLKRHFAADRIVGEEDAAAVRERPDLAKRVVDAIRHAMVGEPAAAAATDDEGRTRLFSALIVLTTDHSSTMQWLGLIDHASTAARGPISATERFWTLDPIDGTKGFLRRQQYAVCLALLDAQQTVQVGVLACPNMPFPSLTSSPTATTGSLAWAVRGHGAWHAPLADTDPLSATPLTVAPRTSATLTVIESYESAHANHALSQRVQARLAVPTSVVRMDSQAKYLAVARGDAHVYLRVVGDVHYREKIWDHAAGALIVHEAGAAAVDVTGRALEFPREGVMSRNVGVVATVREDGLLEKVVKAVQGDEDFARYAATVPSGASPKM